MTADRPPLFDFRTAQMRQARAKAMAGDTFLAQGAIEGLADRLATVTRRFENGLWIGEGLPQTLRGFASQWSQTAFDQTEILAAEPASFDLAVSLFSLQTINDLPGALVQIRRALKPDGLFLGALFGGATLTELRDSFAHAESETLGGISPRISPFADVRDMGALLQRGGFALPVADVERVAVRYGDFANLARDLRAHGQTNALSERRQDAAGRSAGHGGNQNPPGLAQPSRRRSDHGVQLGAHAGDGGNDHHRDQTGHQGIFDGRGAAIVSGKAFHSRSRSMGISGKSAAGMG